MDKIIINFICNWPKDRTKAWSGSLYNLFSEMENDKRIELNDIDISPKNKFEKILRKLKRRYSIPLFLFLYNRIIKFKVKNKLKGNIIFSIEELNFGKKYDHFIYQDLSYSLLYQLKKQKTYGFEYSNNNYTKMDYYFALMYSRKIYKKAKRIFTMSKFLYNHFCNFYSPEIHNKVYYVGAGANSFDKIYTDNIKEKSFVFIGKDFYRKSGDIVCKAFKDIEKNIRKDVKLYIIGPNSFPKEFEDDNIIFLGTKSFHECKEYLIMCKYFIMPSRFEAFGIVFIEALLNGCICIGRNNYEMKNIINEENGFLVNLSFNDKQNVQEVKKSMINALQSNLNIKTIKYYPEYTWKMVKDKIINQIIEINK